MILLLNCLIRKKKQNAFNETLVQATRLVFPAQTLCRRNESVTEMWVQQIPSVQLTTSNQPTTKAWTNEKPAWISHLPPRWLQQALSDRRPNQTGRRNRSKAKQPSLWKKMPTIWDYPVRLCHPVGCWAKVGWWVEKREKKGEWKTNDAENNTSLSKVSKSTNWMINFQRTELLINRRHRAVCVAENETLSVHPSVNRCG